MRIGKLPDNVMIDVVFLVDGFMHAEQLPDDANGCCRSTGGCIVQAWEGIAIGFTFVNMPRLCCSMVEHRQALWH